MDSPMKRQIYISFLTASLIVGNEALPQTQLAEKMRADCLREAQQAPSWVLSEAYKIERVGGFRFVYNLKVTSNFVLNPVRCYALLSYETHLHEGQKNEISTYRRELVDVIERKNISVAELFDYRRPNQHGYGILPDSKGGGFTSYEEVIAYMDKVMSSER